MIQYGEKEKICWFINFFEFILKAKTEYQEITNFLNDGYLT